MTDHDFIIHLQTEITQFLAGAAPAPAPTPIPVPPSPPSTPPAGVTIIPVTWPQGESTATAGTRKGLPEEIAADQVLAYEIDAQQLVGNSEFPMVSFYEARANPGSALPLSITCSISNAPGQFTAPQGIAQGIGQDAFSPRIKFCPSTMTSARYAQIASYVQGQLPAPNSKNKYYINVKANVAGKFYLFYTNA